MIDIPTLRREPSEKAARLIEAIYDKAWPLFHGRVDGLDTADVRAVMNEALAYVAELERIVKDLAAADPVTVFQDYKYVCGICGVGYEDGENYERETFPHAESCPWRRAVATRDGMEGK